MTRDARIPRRIDPLRVVVVLLVLGFAGTVALFALVRTRTVEEKPIALPPVVMDDAGPATPETAAAAAKKDPLDKKSAKSRKAKILKEELQRKRDQKLAAAAASGLTEVVLTGDASLKRTFKRRLSGVRVVDDAARGFMLSLRTDTGRNKDGTVFAKCSAAVSQLPQKKLMASMSSRADVGGEGVEIAELQSDATDACASSLVDDVASWIRSQK